MSELYEIINLPLISDTRGSLVAIESNQDIPFKIKRTYYIFDIKDNLPRGFHAHKQIEQVAICIKGSCRMIFDNGKINQDVWLDSPNKGILIQTNIWHEMHDFSKDCVLLVLASGHYDESDYIRDYQDFLNSVKGK